LILGKRIPTRHISRRKSEKSGSIIKQYSKNSSRFALIANELHEDIQISSIQFPAEQTANVGRVVGMETSFIIEIKLPSNGILQRNAKQDIQSRQSLFSSRVLLDDINSLRRTVIFCQHTLS
jgi:hypothetical protein